MSDIPVLYEDEWLLIVSKPAGLLVHANIGSKIEEPNLQDLLSAGRKRLTLFHRLDKDTSGLVILGKRAEIRNAVTRIFEEKKIRKAYFAVVRGAWGRGVNRVECRLVRGSGGRMIESPEGKVAITTFRVLDTHPEKTWLEAMPKTGRTHQIRVHCARAGHPILGDRIYGEAGPVLGLHAHRVDFAHPKTGESLRIEAPVPEAWKSTVLDGWNLRSR